MLFFNLYVLIYLTSYDIIHSVIFHHTFKYVSFTLSTDNHESLLIEVPKNNLIDTISLLLITHT